MMCELGKHMKRGPVPFLPSALTLSLGWSLSLSGCTGEACTNNLMPGVCVTVAGAWNEGTASCDATVTFFDEGEAIPPAFGPRESLEESGACEQCGLDELAGDFVVRVEHAGTVLEQAVTVELDEAGCHPVTVDLRFPSAAPPP